MRLHTALEHIQNGHFRTMEPWEEGHAQATAAYIAEHASETIEFSFEFLDIESSNDTLKTFIAFANELWDESIAPIPHHFFWVSWYQRMTEHSVAQDYTIQMAAFCERVHSEIDNKVTSLSIRILLEHKNKDGFSFVNKVGYKLLGDHQNLMISHADTPLAQSLMHLGTGVVSALLGALATPQAIRKEEPVPVKLNKQRQRKGKAPIGALIIIDVRASQQMAALRKATGSKTVRPHWRRGHLRHLSNGRITPIPPCCVNMEAGVPVKPEYLVKI